METSELDKAKKQTGLSTVFVADVPKLNDQGRDVTELQLRLNEVAKAGLKADGIFGPATRDAVAAFQKSIKLAGTGVIGEKTLAALVMAVMAKPKPAEPEPEKKPAPPPWYTFAKKFSGKKETDPAFSAEMSKHWKLVGLPGYKTIAGSKYAWCGLLVVVGLYSVGYEYQKDGAAARNHAKYGVGIEWKVDGTPQGAIVHINNAGNCGSASGNHVAFADGDCTAADLTKAGATINLMGGNQQNSVKVSTYSAAKICAVRWPKEHPLRGKITKSVGCTSGKSGNESTR